MHKRILTLTLILGMTHAGYGQTTAPSHLLVCRNGVCILVPAPSVVQAPTPTPTVQAPQVQPPVAAMQTPKGSHAKAIVLTAVVSAVGTWAIYKLFKRKASK